VVVVRDRIELSTFRFSGLWFARGRRELSDLVPASLRDSQAGQGAWRPQTASAPARKVTEALLLRVKILALAP